MFRRLLLALCALIALSASAFAQEPVDTYRLKPAWYEVKGTRVAVPQTHERVGRIIRERAVALAGRPAGCPSRWCGCWLGKHLGMADRNLWRAREWAKVGKAAGGPAPGVIAVWPHHVGKVVAVNGSQIKVLSGNDGHAVRERWRSARGVIAWRSV